MISRGSGLVQSWVDPDTSLTGRATNSGTSIAHRTGLVDGGVISRPRSLEMVFPFWGRPQAGIKIEPVLPIVSGIRNPREAFGCIGGVYVEVKLSDSCRTFACTRTGGAFPRAERPLQPPPPICRA